MAELRYVDWDGLVYYDGKIKEYIQDRDEDYIKMGGIVSFEKLPDPTYYNLHYIYKVTDEFTSNDRFELEGYVYSGGTWVQCVDLDGDGARYRYIIFNEECIGETADVDLSDYYTKKETEQKIIEAVEGLDIPEVDLSSYYTKDEVEDRLEGFATTEELAVLTEDIADLESTVDSIAADVHGIGDGLSSAYNSLNELTTTVDSHIQQSEDKYNTLTSEVTVINNNIVNITEQIDQFAETTQTTLENLTSDVKTIVEKQITTDTKIEEIDKTIENTVTEVINEKIDNGELTVVADSIYYGNF